MLIIQLFFFIILNYLEEYNKLLTDLKIYIQLVIKYIPANHENSKASDFFRDHLGFK